MSPIDVRTLITESLKIGVILFISYTIGAVMNAISEVPFLAYTGDFVREGFVLAGTAIAILYVLLRSVDLSRTINNTESRLTPKTQEFIHESVVLAVPVVLWFTVAGLSMILKPHSTLNSAIETIVLVSTRAGILTAILYVLARGLAALPAIRYDGNESVPADD